MNEIHKTTQFKKDFKRYKHQPKKIKKVLEVVRMLENGVEIPQSYKPHLLIGNYKGCMECHIEGDFLLIWIDEKNNIVELVRLGTHSELFG